MTNTIQVDTGNYIKGVMLVDKKDDHWTHSLKLKQDMAEYFEHGYDDKVCLELGAFRGYTTKLLAQFFSKVIAVDVNKDFQDFAKSYWDYDNIEYHLMDIYKEEWPFVDCDMVFIDGINDYDHRKKDIDKCIECFHNPLLVITDYGLVEGVKQIADEYVDTGRLVIEKNIGMPAGTCYPRTQDKVLLDWEAVICSVHG